MCNPCAHWAIKRDPRYTYSVTQEKRNLTSKDMLGYARKAHQLRGRA